MLRSVPIEHYVNSFEIAQEKVGPNRYVGVINVSYIASQVQALLSRAGIPYVTRRSDPILVVPVTDAAGSAAAWDETSPWRTAWYQAIENARIVVLALPLADLADIAAAPPGALLAGDRAVLDGLGARYGTKTVIVAIARADDPSLSGRVEVELRRADDWPTPILQTAVETEPGADPSLLWRKRWHRRCPPSKTIGSGARLRKRLRSPPVRHRPACRPRGVGANKARSGWPAGGALDRVNSFTQTRARDHHRLSWGHGAVGDVGRADGAVAGRGDGWMAAATGGRIGGVPGAVARYLRYALSVVAGNAANLLTLARLFCAVPIVLLVRAGAYHQAALLFLIAALSDALDGYVAKRFNGVTPLGAVLDPVADKVLMDSLFLTLAFEGHLPAWVACW